MVGSIADYRQEPWEQKGITFTEEDWNPHTDEDMEKIIHGGAGK